MPSPSISELAIAAVTDRLSNVTDGLNPRISQLAAERFLDGWGTISFSDSSSQFFQRQMAVETILATTDRVWPTITVFPVSLAMSYPAAHYHTLDGPFIVGVDAFLSGDSSRPSRTFDKRVRVFIDAMIATFNDTTARDFPASLIWNNGLSMSARVAQDRQGENWMQVLEFRLNIGAKIR